MPAKKKFVKKSVYLVEISRTLSGGVYVKAKSPEAAIRFVKGAGIAFTDDLAVDVGDWEYECDGEDHNDDEPYRVYEDDEEDPPAEETAPAKKKSAKKAPAVAPAVETTTVSFPGGVELAMLPIPGKDYLMGKFPVTQAQWEAVTGGNPSRRKGAENPVECVSWDDCQAFLETLNGQPAAKASGLAFRLPTEDEWDYACRAGAEGDYCKLADGTEIEEETLDEVAWFCDNSDGTTHPVGQKKPNAFGLYDMHGNVWEWTASADGEYRVVRGGGWFDSARDCESSCRNRNSPGFRSHPLGFRLCADRRAD